MDKQQAEKKQLLEQDFKKFIASTIFTEYPQTSLDIERNTLIKRNYPGAESAGFRIAYPKMPEVLERADIKSWTQELCAQLKLSFMSVGTATQYNKDQAFLFIDVSSNHLDEYYMETFKKNMEGLKYGLVYMNNPDMFAWTDRKVALLQQLLEETGSTHAAGEWPMVSLLNKSDANLSFLSNFNVRLITDVAPVEKKKSWGGFIKSLFNKEETVDSQVSSTPDNMLQVIESFNKLVQKRKFGLEKDLVENCDAISRQLKIIHVRNASFKDENMQTYSEIKMMLQDFPKVLTEYSLVPKDHRTDDMRASIMRSTQNILNFVTQAAGDEFNSNLKELKTFEKMTGSRL